jgi:hypothetical protein
MIYYSRRSPWVMRAPPNPLWPSLRPVGSRQPMCLPPSTTPPVVFHGGPCPPTTSSGCRRHNNWRSGSSPTPSTRKGNAPWPSLCNPWTGTPAIDGHTESIHGWPLCWSLVVATVACPPWYTPQQYFCALCGASLYTTSASCLCSKLRRSSRCPLRTRCSHPRPYKPGSSTNSPSLAHSTPWSSLPLRFWPTGWSTSACPTTLHATSVTFTLSLTPSN